MPDLRNFSSAGFFIPRNSTAAKRVPRPKIILSSNIPWQQPVDDDSYIVRFDVATTRDRRTANRV